MEIHAMIRAFFCRGLGWQPTVERSSQSGLERLRTLESWMCRECVELRLGVRGMCMARLRSDMLQISSIWGSRTAPGSN